MSEKKILVQAIEQTIGNFKTESAKYLKGVREIIRDHKDVEDAEDKAKKVEKDIRAAFKDHMKGEDREVTVRLSMYRTRSIYAAKAIIIDGSKLNTLGGLNAAWLKKHPPKKNPPKKSEAEQVGEIALKIAEEKGWDFTTLVAKISTLK